MHSRASSESLSLGGRVTVNYYGSSSRQFNVAHCILIQIGTMVNGPLHWFLSDGIKHS